MGATLLQMKDDLSCDMMNCQTIQCSGPWPLPARAYMALSSGTAIYREKHSGSCTGLKSSTTTVLHVNYMSSQIINCRVDLMYKDVVTWSQCLEHMFICIHQYRVHLLYKPSTKLFIADWLSQTITEGNIDKET